MCHRNLYKGQGKVWVTYVHFPLQETLFFFQKSLVILLPYWKITLFLTSHPSLGLFYCVYHLLSRDQFVCIITHLVLLNFVVKIEQQSFLKTSKILCRIHIALCNVSSMLSHMPHILHNILWPSFPLSSKYNINNLPSLAILKICLGQQFPTC